MLIYALLLFSNKYYIGKTNRNTIQLRFNQHKNKIGSEWTKLYEPIEIIESYETENQFEEDILTKKYMLKYGIENVRGGSYSNITLFDWQIKSLENEFLSVQDACFYCSEIGHFSKDCVIINNNYTIEEIETEIKKLEELRDIINNNRLPILREKYIDIMVNNKKIEIEINPVMITQYNIEKCVKTFSPTQLRYSDNQEPIEYKILSKLTDIRTVKKDIYTHQTIEISMQTDYYGKHRIMENIYKIYINRIKKEKDLLSLIKATLNIDISQTKNTYEQIIEKIDNKIINLYKIYANKI